MGCWENGPVGKMACQGKGIRQNVFSVTWDSAKWRRQNGCRQNGRRRNDLKPFNVQYLLRNTGIFVYTLEILRRTHWPIPFYTATSL